MRLSKPLYSALILAFLIFPLNQFSTFAQQIEPSVQKAEALTSNPAKVISKNDTNSSFPSINKKKSSGLGIDNHTIISAVFALIIIFFFLLLLHNKRLKQIVEKRAQELQKRERNYREIYNAGSDAIIINDAETGKIVDVNKSALEMFGFKRNEVINNTIENIGFSGNSFNLADAVSLTQETQADGSHTFELQIKKKNSELFWAEAILKSDLIGGKKRILTVVRDITERKIAEKDKIETENKLNAIFNHRFQLTGLLDTSGKLLMINTIACNMVGVASSELTGKYFWELPHWSHSEDLQIEIQEAIEKARQGEALSIETTHSDFKGNVKQVEFSLTPVFDDNGEVIYIVPEGRDITEKKRSEIKLIESERNYREVYNSSSDAIFIHDAETGKVIDVNQTMLDMYGYTRQEALKLTIGDISSGKPLFSEKEASEKVEKAVNEGPQVFEWLARHKNGISFWVEVALRKTEIGGKGRVLAVVRDITQRKKLDSELRLVKHTIEHSSYPFEWIQKDARFFYVNKASCHSLGYTKEELYSMRVTDIDTDFSAELWPEFWEELKSKKTLTFKSHHLKKDGKIFPVEITANHLEFEGQEHVFAYVKDISSRTQFENKQKNLEKQLQQAHKMEAIGTLASGIAHDFNNILSAIIGFSEVALEDIPENSAPYSYVQQVTAAGYRAGKLVEQILAFSRQQDLELKPLRVHLIIKEALKLLRSSIPATIEIKSYIDPNCGLVLSDPTQIHQIIMNLCTNAYHAMKAHGGTLSVNLRPVNRTSEDNLSGDIFLEPGPYLELEVSDTGHGISAKDLEKVFDPYFTTKKKEEGTGLGLAIVHGIVNDFNGNLTVKSIAGKETTFHVYLPVIKEAAPAKGVFKKTDSLPRGNQKILFIDDEKGVVGFSKIMLESLGYKVIGFTDSLEAFETFKNAPDDFDLIITDMTMPNMTGKDILLGVQEIKPDMPMILCTGYSDTLSRDHAEKLGFREYIEKPVLKRELATKIKNIFNRKPEG